MNDREEGGVITKEGKRKGTEGERGREENDAPL